MEQRPTVRILAEEFRGVLAREDRPKNVHLERNVARIGLFDEQVEVRLAVFPGEELVTVVVVIEADPVLRENFAGVVENFRRGKDFRFVEFAVVRQPSDARVFQPERFRLFTDGVRVVFEEVVVPVARDRRQLYCFSFATISSGFMP